MTYRILGYLDPGTGSFFIQLLIGATLGTLFCLWQLRRGAPEPPGSNPAIRSLKKQTKVVFN